MIDDTAVILQLYDDILSDEGHEVHLDAGPTLDLDRVEQLAPDLIILDYLFGQEASGMLMVQQLLMRPSTARIPLIVCTAAVNLMTAVQPDLERQGIAVLHKPFRVADLLDLIARAVAPPVRPQSEAAQ